MGAFRLSTKRAEIRSLSAPIATPYSRATSTDAGRESWRYGRRRIGRMDEEALDQEISTFERMRDDLACYGSDWIVMAGQRVAGHFQQFEDAARFVAARFPDAPALVRQVNPAPIYFPCLMIEG
jgi:hypothetical protein